MPKPSSTPNGHRGTEFFQLEGVRYEIRFVWDCHLLIGSMTATDYAHEWSTDIKKADDLLDEKSRLKQEGQCCTNVQKMTKHCGKKYPHGQCKAEGWDK